MESITKELRKWGYGFCGDTYEVVNAIADRIDAEHKSALASAYGEGAESVALPDMTAYTKLPVDAGGVPIRVGDVMECDHGTVFTVESISLYAFGWRCDGDGIDGNGYKCTAHPLPHICRHHHRTPTVEDVLREIVHKCQPTYSKDGSYTTGLTKEEFAEYAAKLRLAGDGE